MILYCCFLPIIKYGAVPSGFDFHHVNSIAYSRNSIGRMDGLESNYMDEIA